MCDEQIAYVGARACQEVQDAGRQACLPGYPEVLLARGRGIARGPENARVAGRPGRQLKAPLAHQLSHAEANLCTFFGRGAFPRIERAVGRGDRTLRLNAGRLLKDADDLFGIRRTVGEELVLGLDALAPDDERPFAGEH